MASPKKSKKPSPKTKSPTQKKESMHFIELMPHTFTMLQELKESFAEITESSDIEDDDVINILIQGFIESTNAHAQAHGGCGSDEKKKEKGECCGGGACHSH